MNTGIGSIVKHKATIEKVIKMDGPVCLYNPRECNGDLYVCSYAGEIIHFKDTGEYEVYMTWIGQPSCNLQFIKVSHWI